jgi:hypothetical protein
VFLKEYQEELYAQKIKDTIRKGEKTERDRQENLQNAIENARKMAEREQEFIEESQARLRKFKNFREENEQIYEERWAKKWNSKDLLLEQKVQRRNNLKEKVELEVKQGAIDKKSREKEEYNSVLKLQLESEKIRKKNDKNRYEEQADLWKNEREEFLRQEKERKDKQQEMYRRNQQDLLEQIKEKEDRKKLKDYKMTQEELKINAKILEEMKELRHSKHSSLQGILG